MAGQGRSKDIDITSDSIQGDGRLIKLGDIGKTDAIEAVTTEQYTKGAIALEAFMNEMLEIMIHPSPIEEDLDVQTPSVNGINQPIERGKPLRIKRKYVEALARCRITKYVQIIDPIDRSNIQMKERTVVAYPFSILEDRNPKGAPWIKGILAEQ